MTQIEIPLPLEENFISFPATSTDTLKDILISSGIKDNILDFAKWNSIQQKFVSVDIGTSGTEQIEICNEEINHKTKNEVKHEIELKDNNIEITEIPLLNKA